MAAEAGHIQPGSARPNDPRWIRSLMVRLRAIENRLSVEKAETRARQAGILVVVGAASNASNLAELSQQHERLVDQHLDRLSPWAAKAREKDDQDGVQKWIRRYGDPNSPETKRLIDKQIKTLRRLARGG